MKNSRYMSIHENGHLMFSGCDTVELAKKYETPLYVVSEDCIRDKCRELKRDFLQKYDNTKVLYASKAFITVAMCKIINEEGVGLDVVSSGELYCALKAEFPAERIYFHGNNKTEEEIRFAVENNIGCMVIDNLHEMELLQKIAKEMRKQVNGMLRVSPGISAHTHEYLATGQLDSKFGFPIEGDKALEAVRETLNCPNLKFKGIHCHIGSQIFNVESYRQAASIMTDFMVEIKEKLGIEIEELNLGGGFGIHYAEGDEPKAPREYTDAMMEILKQKCEENHMKLPCLLIEPGRWIVASAGITLYTVGAIKEIEGIRTYVSIDGGMNDNPRPSMYDAEYEGDIVNKMKEDKNNKVSISGKCCESGDILIWDIKVPSIKAGDILGVYNTGAYNYSMASNYNKLRRPAVVMVKGGKSSLTVRRETYKDLLKNEIIGPEKEYI